MKSKHYHSFFLKGLQPNKTYENISPYQTAYSLLKDTILQFRGSQVKARNLSKISKTQSEVSKIT